MKRRTGLTPGQHVECGRLIKTARDALMEAEAMVRRAYGAKSPAGLQLHRVVRLGGPLDKARCKLDDLIFSEVPSSRDPRGLTMCVYYGSHELRHDPAAGVGALDVFAGYDREST